MSTPTKASRFEQYKQRQKEVRKFLGTCGHGKECVMELHLPLTVEILDCAESDQDESEWAVWLKSGAKHYVTLVAPVTKCGEQAALIAKAVGKLLETPEGQDAAIAFIVHDLELTEVKS